MKLRFWGTSATFPTGSATILLRRCLVQGHLFPARGTSLLSVMWLATPLLLSLPSLLSSVVLLVLRQRLSPITLLRIRVCRVGRALGLDSYFEPPSRDTLDSACGLWLLSAFSPSKDFAEALLPLRVSAGFIICPSLAALLHLLLLGRLPVLPFSQIRALRAIRCGPVAFMTSEFSLGVVIVALSTDLRVLCRWCLGLLLFLRRRSRFPPLVTHGCCSVGLPHLFTWVAAHRRTSPCSSASRSGAGG